jgi:DUF1680 family protein
MMRLQQGNAPYSKPLLGSLGKSLVPLVSILLVQSLFSPALRAADALLPVDIRKVRVEGEIGRRIDVTCNNNLMVADLDKDFLAPFKVKDLDSGYIGLGKTIDAAVRLAAYTGDPKVLERKNHLVAETLSAQEPDGYIGMLKPGARVSALWDVHEMGYIVLGLVSDYRFFGDKKSLEGAAKLADYIVDRWPSQPDNKIGGGRITEYMAVTGVESAMLALHQASGEKKYLDFCVKVRQLAEWDASIVTGRWGQVEGHAYAHMCRSIAQLRLHRIQPEAQLLQAADDVVEFLAAKDGLVVTGTSGVNECWQDSQEGIGNLGETCATAYLVRLLDELLRMRADSQYGDLMERSIYNALFAAQSPDGRQLRYYVPFDGPRVYFDRDTYCCPTNYRRIVAELPQMIYYQADNGLAVNLYAPSEAEFGLQDGLSVKLRQETDYPHSGHVVLRVDPSKPSSFNVKLRIPAWCHDASVRINDEEAIQKPQPGQFLSVNRSWKKGDVVTLDMPMPVRLVKGRKAQQGRVAIMRGPVVFCLNPSQNDKLKDIDLRLITLDPDSLEGPFPDDSVHPGGLKCRARAWSPGRLPGTTEPDLELTFTEFPDPGGESVYLKIPNPNDKHLVDDELVKPLPQAQ